MSSGWSNRWRTIRVQYIWEMPLGVPYRVSVSPLYKDPNGAWQYDPCGRGSDLSVQSLRKDYLPLEEWTKTVLPTIPKDARPIRSQL